MISATDWDHLRRGLLQRIRALNLFLNDIYGDQRLFADTPIPKDLVLGAAGYLPELRHVRPAGDTRAVIAGIDLIRDPDGTFRVLAPPRASPTWSKTASSRSVSSRASSTPPTSNAASTASPTDRSKATDTATTPRLPRLDPRKARRRESSQPSVCDCVPLVPGAGALFFLP